MPNYKVEGTVMFAWETEVEAANEADAREIAEEEVLEGQHLDLGANSLGTTKVKEVADA